jgi:hypothetical protein
VFTAHTNEEEFYCVLLCGASTALDADYGSGFAELRVQYIATAVGAEQWTPDVKVIAAVTSNPCPVACNGSTRGKIPLPEYVCGAQAPGMRQVAQQYMFIKSKGVKQGQQGRGASISKKQCTKSGNAFLC